MPYTRTNWVDKVTPINATNMNNIEDGIEEIQTHKSRTATYVIAASDTLNKEGADYICESSSGNYFPDIIDTIMADMTTNPNRQGSKIVVRNGTYYFPDIGGDIYITKPCHLIFEGEFDYLEGSDIWGSISISSSNVIIENAYFSNALTSSGENVRLFNCNLAGGCFITGGYSYIINSKVGFGEINAKYCVMAGCIVTISASKPITIGSNCQYSVFCNNVQDGVANPKDIYDNLSSHVNYIECAVNDEQGRNIVDTYQTKILPDYTTITTPTEGRQAWNATTKKPVWYNGTVWIYADGTVVS